MLDGTTFGSGANSDSAENLPPVPEYLKTRGKLFLLTCAGCPTQFWRPRSKLATARFCSPECRDVELRKRSIEVNRERVGPLNHNWRGGVTLDMTEYMRQQRITHAEKWAARKAVYSALRKGTLVKGPCVDCGSTDDIEADHHNGYAPEHWLDIRWRCTKHHGEQRRGVPLPKKAETLARLGMLCLTLLLFTAVEAALCAVTGGLE